MSVADKLNSVIDGLTEAYAAIEEKGGTVPEQKNFENLAIAIQSVPQGPVDPAADGGEWGKIGYLRDGEVQYYVATSSSDLTNLASSTKSRTFKTLEDGFAITSDNTVSYAMGSEQTSTADYFLSACDNLEKFFFSPKGKLSTIGQYFLRTCPNLNCPLTVPDSVTRINSYFLGSCTTFNSPVKLSSKLTYLGSNFMAYCSSFNSKITLRGDLTAINNMFLEHCTDFNQPLDFLKNLPLQTVGEGFLSYCTSFNQPVILPDSVLKVGYGGSGFSGDSGFLKGCSSFNAELYLGKSVVTIGDYFLTGCTVFNQPIELPDTLVSLTTYYGHFLENCYAFNQPLTVPSSVTRIGMWFLNHCHSFLGPLFVEAPISVMLSTEDALICYFVSGPWPKEYALGVKVGGTYAKEWLEALPNGSIRTYDYRRLYLYEEPSEEPYAIARIQFSTDAEPETVEIRNRYQLFDMLSGRNKLSRLVELHFQPAVSNLEEVTVLPYDNGESFGFSFYTSLPATMGGRFSGLEYFTHLTAIGDKFLYYSTSSSSSAPAFTLEALPDFSNVTSIGTYFLSGCTTFSGGLSLPNVTSIGDYFLYNTNNFAGPLDVGQSPAPMDTNYMMSTTSSSATEYSDGIALIGENAQAWVDALPTRTSSPYRRLSVLPDLPDDPYVVWTDSLGGQHGIADKEQFLNYVCTGNERAVGMTPTVAKIITFYPKVAELEEITTLPYNDGEQFLYLQKGEIHGLEYFAHLTKIGGNFLRSCTGFNQPLELPESLTSIGDRFMYGCSAFNQPLIIPDNVSSIGTYFMYSCTAFNQSLTLPKKFTLVPQNFIYMCHNFTGPLNIRGALNKYSNWDYSNVLSVYDSSTPPASYTEGIAMSGIGAAGYKELYKKMDGTNPYGYYRNLYIPPDPTPAPAYTTITEFAAALKDGTASEKFPVGTELADKWNGEDAPLIVTQYLPETGMGYSTAVGAICMRKYVNPVSKQLTTAYTNYSSLDVVKWLNGSEYKDACSDELKGVIGSYISTQAQSTAGSSTLTWAGWQWQLMSTYEVMGNDYYLLGRQWDYWKQKTELTSKDEGANTGRIPYDKDGNACSAWLRTSRSATQYYTITENGAIGYDSVTGSTPGVWPFCYIPK